MSYAERHVVSITTDADGNGTGYTPVVTGKVQTIRYIKPASGGYADTVDFTITADASGESVLAVSNVTASATYAPRQATCTTAGAASLYAAGGAAVNDGIVLANDRVKIVVAQGGDTRSGTFHVVIA